jgi:hypothetical protein
VESARKRGFDLFERFETEHEGKGDRVRPPSCVAFIETISIDVEGLHLARENLRQVRAQGFALVGCKVCIGSIEQCPLGRVQLSPDLDCPGPVQVVIEYRLLPAPRELNFKVQTLAALEEVIGAALP